MYWYPASQSSLFSGLANETCTLPCASLALKAEVAARPNVNSARSRRSEDKAWSP